MTIAVLTRLPAASRSDRASSRDTLHTSTTIRSLRSRSFAFVALRSTIRLPYVLPMRIIAPVVIMLSTILVAVPALRRVDPVTTSGPTIAITATSTCDPATELQTFVDLTISPGVGAEVIAGSTRLKAGTATKMVLNMLTTGAMIRIGKTYGNLMVDVQTGSEKLKDRARRIVNIVTGLEYDDSDKLLKKAHWNVKAAIVMQKTGLPYPKALSRLRKAHDSMREALGEDIEPRLRGMLQGAAEASSNGRPL